MRCVQIKILLCSVKIFVISSKYQLYYGIFASQGCRLPKFSTREYTSTEDWWACEKSSSHGRYTNTWPHNSYLQRWNNTSGFEKRSNPEIWESLGHKSVHRIRTVASKKYIRHILPKYLCFPQTTISPRRNHKGENSRRRKLTLLKKAYEYGELSGADIAFFIYQSGRWFTYKSTDRQSFPPSWEQIVSVVTKYICNANKRIAKVISSPG